MKNHLRGTMTPNLQALATLVLLQVLLPALATAGPVQVDAATLGAQNLRPYTHVFIAYTIAWLLVFGWLFSVARRLTRIERKLGD